MTVKNARKAAVLLILTLILLPVRAFFCPAAFAENGGDTAARRKGSLCIVADEKTIGTDSYVTLFFAAKALPDGGYEYTEQYGRCSIPLDKIGRKETAGSLAAFTLKNGIEGERRFFDGGGRARYTELEEGIYLIVGDRSARFEPFTLVIPQYDEKTASYNFDVTAYPKVSGDTPPATSPSSSSFPATVTNPHGVVTTAVSSSHSVYTPPGDSVTHSRYSTTGRNTGRHTDRQTENNENNSENTKAEVKNERLPQTGLLWWPVLLLFGIGAGFILSAFTVNKIK